MWPGQENAGVTADLLSHFLATSWGGAREPGKWWCDLACLCPSLTCPHSAPFAKNLSLPPAALRAFTADVLSTYRDNAFHNAWHACDVLASVHCIALSAPALSAFPDCELLALYLAALLHDAGHPGLSNNFIRALPAHPIRELRGTSSPLERHHAALAAELLGRHRSQLFAGMGAGQVDACLALVEACILATDVERNGAYLEQIKEALPAEADEAAISAALAGSARSREALACMVMKVADIGNLSKSWPLALRWSQLLKCEFLLLAQRELEAGLPQTPFLSSPVPESSKGFISFVGGPMTRALAAVLPWVAELPVAELERNVEEWGRLAGTEGAPGALPLPAVHGVRLDAVDQRLEAN